jgi:hypothetical protein
MLDKIINKKWKDIILKYGWTIANNISHMLEDDGREHINQKHWMYLFKALKPGDVLLSEQGNPFSSIFIPGRTKHASIVTTDDDGWPTVVESISEGVVETPLFDHIEGKRLLVHCRSKFVSQKGAEHAAFAANSFIGTAYDKLYSLENPDQYCSELIKNCYWEAWQKENPGIDAKCFPLKTHVRYGEETFLPDDIRTDPKNWDMLWSNTK